jgi:uncharacterized Zn finger protein
MSIQYVKCPKCGNDEFKMFRDPKPDDVVTCMKCGLTMPHAKYVVMRDEQFAKARATEVSKFRKGLKKL